MIDTTGAALEYHRLDDSTIDALAEGYGGVPAIEALWRGQRSHRLLLFRLARDLLEPTADRDEAVAAIVDAANRAPAEARTVLVDPMVGLWAAGTVRHLRAGTPAAPADAAHLGAVAASAALRAGTRAELHGRARRGWLHLPGIGRLHVGGADRKVRLRTADGLLMADGAEYPPDDPAWQRARTLTISEKDAVRVEDLDPYRDVFHVPAAERLEHSEFETWQRRVRETWRILTAFLPERAKELSAGLHSLVPLQKPSTNAAHSATTREAVGVIALNPPDTLADLAVTLTHEFQHSKLCAVLDMVKLYRPSNRRFFAPWRTDARPVGGLFQGVYAFIGVADTWRALSTDPQRFPQAQREFARSRTQVSDALDTLAGSEVLTPAGDRFLGGMRRAVARLHETPVPRQADADARRLLKDRQAAWEASNADP